MISEKFLKILVCPINQRSLVWATPQVLKKVNTKIRQKKCYTVQKKRVNSPLKTALYEPGSGLVYRVEDNIPILLKEEAIDGKEL